MRAWKSGDEFHNCTAISLADLTPRELEILQLILEGKTNKGIACEIEISVKTVEFHLDNLYRKIGVQTRIMAGLWAIRQGLQMQKQIGIS
jgi:DNA-binding NarL/FixJ family response regulator